MPNRSYSPEELIRHASLTLSDLEQINRCRRDYNRLGFAYQIGFVRLLNQFPTPNPFEIIDELLTFTSVHLQISESAINQYAQRQQTVSQHQIQILDYLTLKRFSDEQRQLLQKFVFEEACRLEQTSALFLRAEQFLREQKILRPATSSIERIIGEQREQARQYIFTRITDALPEEVIRKLDNLLLVGDNIVSLLQLLKEPPGVASAAAMKQLTAKISIIEATGVFDVDLSWLNNNYQRALASYAKSNARLRLSVRKRDAYWLRAIEPLHRYGALVCFLWDAQREYFFRQSSLPKKGCDAADYLSEQLSLAYDRFLETLPNNTYAQVEKDGWHLSVDSDEPLDPTVEAKIDQLKGWLKKHQRQIKLPQLLIEVDNELHFTRHFLTLAQSKVRPVDEICAIIAAIMAHGCNIGPETMSQLTQQVTYKQIKQITDWQLTPENQRSALANVVNAIAALDTTQRWGEGKTSASDGQRFAFRRKVLQRNYSHKFSDYALEFYSFIADNYAPFYGVPIECNERDAPYVIDGLLYNESDLQLEEHYTDTHGYTEINFAAFAMLGKEFCPR
jgi:TnpA family transposase